MGIIRSPAYNYYNDVVSEELEEALNGLYLIKQGDKLPVGIETITSDKLKSLKGKARRGRPGQPIPREIGELETKVVYMLNIAHGFYLHEDKLTAAQNSGQKLPDTAARQSAQLVSKDLNDFIFNGDAGYKTDGILDTTLEIAVANGSQWNSVGGGDPETVINDAFTLLEQNDLFTGRKLGLRPVAYRKMFKRIPNTSATYASLIAEYFDNGVNDIIKVPVGFPTGVDGVLGDYGPKIAERVPSKDIILKERSINEDGNIPYNIETDQSIDVKETDAFVLLKNLIDTTRLPVSGGS